MTAVITETSTPLLVDVEGKRNVTDLLIDRVERAPDHIAFRVPAPFGAGELADITTREFHDLVAAVARGFIAAGVSAGDTIAVQGPTSYAWAVTDLAALWVGAIVVPIFDTSSSEQVRHIVRDARVSWFFGDTELQRAVAAASNRESDGTAPTVWSLDFSDLGLGGLVEAGREISDETLDERRQVAGLDDTATLVYTSGTEGRPKGVIITHRNLMGQVLNVGADYREVVNDAGRTLIFLPLAHVLARGLQLICLTGGMRISYEADPAAAVASLSEVQPTFLVVVPRVLQRISDRIAKTAADKRLGGLWARARATAIEVGRFDEATQSQPGLQMPLGLRLRRALYGRLFFGRVRELLGGHVSYLLSGAAPLGAELGLLFRGMGVEVIEGYGLTETTAPLTGNRPGDNYSGTVGRPEPGHTVRISAEGEILAKGTGVSPGYWDPRDNETAFIDGFLRTGDLGTLDAEGHLTVTGRRKELIVTAGGKNISPQRWQHDVETEPLVAHAVVVGEARAYPGALILLDAAELAEAGIGAPVAGQAPQIVTNPEILGRILPVLARANERVSQPERVKRFAVYAADLAPGGSLVTPTMKLRRQYALTAMAPEIDELYRSGHDVP